MFPVFKLITKNRPFILNSCKLNKNTDSVSVTPDMSCIGLFSLLIPSSAQILTSMSSLVGEGSVTLNHGGELIIDFIPGYPSLCLRGAGLAAISLPDLSRVGEREGGVGSLDYDSKASYSYADETK